MKPVSYTHLKSIVEDTPGVTRDRIYGKAEWLTREFRVIDTGGIQLADQDFQTEINMQVEIAIDEADCIVFVVSGKDGLTHDDEYVARLLHRTKKPVILAVNKVDDFAQNDAKMCIRDSRCTVCRIRLCRYRGFTCLPDHADSAVNAGTDVEIGKET